jgi:hypothetical protein
MISALTQRFEVSLVGMEFSLLRNEFHGTFKARQLTFLLISSQSFIADLHSKYVSYRSNLLVSAPIQHMLPILFTICHIHFEHLLPSPTSIDLPVKLLYVPNHPVSFLFELKLCFQFQILGN